MTSQNQRNLSDQNTDELVAILKKRFHTFPERHGQVTWDYVEKKLSEQVSILSVLYSMEHTGGEPDVVKIYPDGQIEFYDCSPESPDGRRNLCYDRKALDERKTFKPANSALDVADELGFRILNEEEYRFLQTLGAFDQKTSSWIYTPEPIRKLGGALFGDRRFNHVFIYHNGASSYYGARGFRGAIRF